ncbi:MAG: phosphotransferase, partial [Hungatella sp.]
EVLNPFVTSSNDGFNRLVPGFEAPVCIVTSVGHSYEVPSRNRSILVGLIRDLNSPLATRFELRSPNPLSNTYLVIAGAYQTIIHGIKAVAESKLGTKELEKELSKDIGENSFYLEKNRAYRDENDVFEDYEEVRGWMQELLDYLDKLGRPEYLSHIDSVADNFLFLPDGRIRLIDWEYAGMCDPLIDVAMCAIYSYYDEDEVERLMQIYLERTPTQEERLVMDAYIALGGFLWSLWAVYKASLGEEFGEYTIIMYRYAKTYYRKFLQNL